MNITGRAIVCPYAEVGMDVDKPHQLEIMRADLRKRSKQAEKGSRSSRKKATPVKAAGKTPKAATAKKKVPARKTTKK